MQKIRYGLIVLCMLLCSVNTAQAQVSIHFGTPSVRIGINLPLFPELVPVPGYPVYYAPRVNANYFFYDGMYWVYQYDNWYASYWYNGPWELVYPEFVPVFILRIPVRYYQRPPVYFRHWHSHAPPRWGERWGHSWEQRRRGWDRWKRDSAPARAPLPVYQRRYSGDRYPRMEQQRKLRNQNYRYQPRERLVRERFAEPSARQRGRQEKPRQHDIQRPVSPGQKAPADRRAQPPSRGGDRDERRDRGQRAVPVHPPAQQRGPGFEGERQQRGPAQREQQAPRAQGQERRSQDKKESHEPGRGRGQGQDKDEGRGRGRD